VAASAPAVPTKVATQVKAPVKVRAAMRKPFAPTLVPTAKKATAAKTVTVVKKAKPGAK
jgi:CO dehydrogenase/acetyl-CoA synthase epsilon subunit